MPLALPLWHRHSPRSVILKWPVSRWPADRLDFLLHFEGALQRRELSYEKSGKETLADSESLRADLNGSSMRAIGKRAGNLRGHGGRGSADQQGVYRDAGLPA